MTNKRSEKRKVRTPKEAIDGLIEIYTESAGALRAAFNHYIETGEPPADEDRRNGKFCYPLLSLTYRPERAVPALSRAYGKLDAPGVFETDVANPSLFADYLLEQLTILHDEYGCDLEIGRSESEIPYPYVLESGKGVDVDAFPPSELARLFPTPDLAAVDDAVPNGDWLPSLALDSNRRGLDPAASASDIKRPLSLFSALRTDYSLQRLRHYTGTDPEDIQPFILFTNYHRYMDEFVDLAVQKLHSDPIYEELVAPGGVRVNKNTKGAEEIIRAAPWRRHQMPAYHLTAKGRAGVTLVNIGVGPSNAKTITDHLAVLRPQCWIMIGHCGGLRQSQRLGDYVLAHAYLRYDGVLDEDLPPEIPVPPIAEIQQALFAASANVTGDTGAELKARLRTGTVVTNDDRNWELRFSHEARKFNQSRAIAVDMESATIAANGYRFRVPYGTLLCVSDKPLHGEIKLPGAANRFYERAISEHMRIGIETIELLRAGGAHVLHSRKLRSFDEPPFR